MHASDLATKYLRSSDGRTAYERRFGKSLREEGYEFAEQVYYMRPATRDRNVILEPRWTAGTWLGRKWGVAYQLGFSWRCCGGVPLGPPPPSLREMGPQHRRRRTRDTLGESRWAGRA